jgi:hypothetical protein
MSDKANEKAGRVQAQQQAPTSDIEAGSDHTKQCSSKTTRLLSGIGSFMYWVAALFVTSSLMFFMMDSAPKIELDARDCTRRPDWSPSPDDYTASDILKFSCGFLMWGLLSELAANGLLAVMGFEPMVWR